MLAAFWRMLADWCVPDWSLRPWGDLWWPFRDEGG